MSKIAFIGAKNYHRSFKLLGFECFESEEEKQAQDLIKQLKQNNFELIFVTDDLMEAGGMGVVVLPGLKQQAGRQKTSIKQQIEKALGGAISPSFLDSK